MPLFFFFTRPAVNAIGVKCIPPTSPSVNVPIIFTVLATVEVQGSHHNESCLDFAMGCHVQKVGAESEHLDGVPSSLVSGLGDNRVQALANNFGILPMEAGSTDRTPVTSLLVCMQWSCNDLFTVSKGVWKKKAGFGICVFNSSS